jgi:NADH:ubiquinone oxidoreductase subunit C
MELPLPIRGLSTPTTARMGYLTWHLFELGARQRCLVLQIGATGSSSEAFFRNARWLEREAGEMAGVHFLNKRDRRTLFGLPIFYSNPLRKAFPVGGAFDLGLCPLTQKLVFKHVSWLS